MAVGSSTPPPGWPLDAADRVCALAEPVRSRAVRHLVDDVQSVARRRRHLFVVATMVAGMATGRALRVAWADDDVEERERGSLDALLQRMWPG